MSTPVEVQTSPKNARTPQRRTQQLWDAIAAIAEEYDRLTIRQLYYQLVSRGVIPKTENSYKRPSDAAAQMRLSGVLPYRKIADGHRTRRAVYAHGGLQDALESAHDLYRRNYWLDQPWHVEVWCEKDALTGVIQPVCEGYGVTYVATRGFPSITLRYESAFAMREIGKPTMIFYFGDHDASGQQISDNLEAELRQHGADVHVERVALDPIQVQQWALPTRPGKTSDSRHAAFTARYGDAAVELDALPPNVLTELVRRAIRSMVDEDAWERAKAVEELERQTLASITSIPWQAGAVYHLSEGDAA